MWPPKQRLLFLEVSDGCFRLLECDFCLLDWIRVDFTSQIQINKQIVKTLYDSVNYTRIPKEVLQPD